MVCGAVPHLELFIPFHEQYIGEANCTNKYKTEIKIIEAIKAF